MILWIAQGLGVGRIPVAPGTFGSVVGIAWTALLLLPGNLAVFVVGTLAGLALSVYGCGRAEKILGKTDPGSVVMDEIAALPVCFIAWIAVAAGKLGQFPTRTTCFRARMFGGLRACSRRSAFFDVAKPWPVHGSQALPGGWGVTTDDFLAAIYVNLAALLVFALGRLAAVGLGGHGGRHSEPRSRGVSHPEHPAAVVAVACRPKVSAPSATRSPLPSTAGQPAQTPQGSRRFSRGMPPQLAGTGLCRPGAGVARGGVARRPGGSRRGKTPARFSEADDRVGHLPRPARPQLQSREAGRNWNRSPPARSWWSATRMCACRRLC